MNKFTRRQITLGAAAAAAGGLSGSLALPARAAGYPERDITFISPWSAGGSLDVVLRQYCKQMEKVLNCNLNLVNQPGASGTLGTAAIYRAKPDGYTIGYGGASALVYLPLVMKGLPWTKVDDFQMLAKLNAMPTLLAVRADSHLKTFDDFVKEVRAKPNQVRVGVAGPRTPADMEMQQLNMAGDMKLRTVPFSGGTGESILALLGGRIEAIVSYTDGLRPQVEAKAMRVLAVFGKGRYAPFPDATPVADVPAFSNLTMMPSCTYIISPKGLPADILDKLVTASRQVVTSDEFKAFSARSGMVHDPLSPDGIRAELAAMAKTYENLNKFLNLDKS